MKLNILDVPAGYANAPAEKVVDTVEEPIKNPTPLPDYSPRTPRDEALKAVVDLAKKDGWLEVYDFHDPSKVTITGGKVARVKGQLGSSLPDLVPLDPAFGLPAPSRGYVGAIGGIDGGMMRFESGIDETDATVMTVCSDPLVTEPFAYRFSLVAFSGNLGADDTSHVAALTLLGGSLGTNATQGQAYTFPIKTMSSKSSLAFTDASGAPAPELEQVTYGVVQPEPMIVSFSNHLGSLRVGGRLVPVDEGPGAIGSGESGSEESGGDESVAKFKGLTIGNYHPGAVTGTVLVASGRLNAAARERMVTLLQKLSGAPASLPNAAQGVSANTNFASSSVSATGGVLSSAFLPDRPSQLASITKVLTCLLVKEVVPDSKLDDLIEYVTPYLNLDQVTTRVPIMRQGDRISWRDAIHLSLMVSHNHLTNVIAWHAGKLMSPGTNDPYGVFMNKMNTRTRDEWGWAEAVFATPQGRYNNILTPRHTNQLLSRYTGFLLSALGTIEHTYKIYHEGESEPEEGTAINLVRPGAGGIPNPELIGGKGGDTPVVAGKGEAYATVTARYKNPGSVGDQVATLLDTGTAATYRYPALADVIDTTRRLNGPPADWLAPGNGLILRAERRGSTDTAVASLTAESWEGGSLSIEPINTFTSPRPRLWKGDLVTASVIARGPADISKAIRLKASLIGGRFLTSSGFLISPPIATSTANEFTLNISGVASSGGTLKLEVVVDGGISGDQFVAARQFKLKIEHDPEQSPGEYTIPLQSFSIEEQSQSGDSSDLSGSVGSFTAVISEPKYKSVIRDFGPGYLQGKQVRMTTEHGAIKGNVIGTTGPGTDGLVTIECASEMSVLNVYNITAQPFSGSLIGLFEYYFGLAGGNSPRLTFDEALVGRSVVVPGWHGDLWTHLKMLCAAEGVQMALNADGGVLIEPNLKPREGWFAVIDETPQFPLHSLAQSVEVYNYNSREIENQLVYPPGGWDRDVPLLSVEAGEEIEHVLELSASITEFQEPTFQTSVGPDHISSSVYTIIGDDEVHINRAQWIAGGGSITFELGKDTRSIIVRMRGATGLGTLQGTPMRTFSLALSAGDSSSRYSTLRIVGTGVSFDRRKIVFPTGVSEQETSTEVGATIDSPFINSIGKAADAGIAAAARFSGFDPSISISAPKSPAGHLGAKTLGSGVIASGGRYAVRRASYVPGGISMQADYATTWGDFEDKVTGTYREVEDRLSSMTYREVRARGLRYGA